MRNQRLHKPVEQPTVGPARLFVGLLILALPLLFFAGFPMLTATAQDVGAPAGGSGPVSLVGAQAAGGTATFTPTATATSTATSTATNTPTSTVTKTPTPDSQIYVDRFEPNNNLANATTITVGASSECNLTLWPVGDLDYFRFFAKVGEAYRISTTIDEPNSNLDTFLRVFNPQGGLIGSNDDDGTIGQRDSVVEILASRDGFYFAEVSNLSPADPTNQRYCIQVIEVTPPTAAPTFTPTPTINPGATPDAPCEPNNTFNDACFIVPGTAYAANFVPPQPPGPDNDFYRIWVRTGQTFTCTANPETSVTDTNMIFYDQNYNGLAGNADIDFPGGNLGSEITYTFHYDGWMYILIGPQNMVDYEISGQFRYSLICEQRLSTPTPTASPTSPGSGGTTSNISTPTPFATTTPFVFPPTPTQINLSILTPLAPTPPPNVQIIPVPTATPGAGAGQGQSLDLLVTLYYDTNLNFSPELNEGIMDLAVAIYDGSTGQLLSFGYTNEAGLVRFAGISAAGPVRISVPFLSFNQTVAATQSNVVLRVAPRPLPIGIP